MYSLPSGAVNFTSNAPLSALTFTVTEPSPSAEYIYVIFPDKLSNSVSLNTIFAAYCNRYSA